MSKAKVGIIGSKFAASLHAHSYKQIADAEVVAACSSQAENVRRFAERFGIPRTYTDYREMLEKEKLDLVSVCVPNYLHRDVAVAAAEARVHIACEKPLARTVEEAQDVVAAVRRAGVRLLYCEDWLFSPIASRVKAICKEGAIGRTLYVKAREAHSGSHSRFSKTLVDCGGGALFFLGVHPIGFVRWLKEQEVVEVTGVATAGGKGNLRLPEYEGEDFGIAVLKFEDGSYALVEGNYITLGGMDDRVEVFGDKGRIVAELTFGSPLRVFSTEGVSYAVEKAETTKGWTRPAVDEEWNLGFPQEMAAAVACARENKEPMWGARVEDGLEIMRIAFAALQSAREGRKVSLRPS